MADDIKTVRKYLNQNAPYCNGARECLAALERISSRLANLQRCAVQGQEMAKEQMDKCVAAERERNSLHAKLERAKEVLAETRRLVSQCALHGFVGEAPLQELFVNNGKISASLAELSNDVKAEN